MKNLTKLWLLMLTSAIVSLLIFFLLILVAGRIGDKGYNLTELYKIADELIHSILINTSNVADVGPLLDRGHQEHPSIQFEWINSDGTSIYDTSGNYLQYEFKHLATRMSGMPQNLWGEDEQITLTHSVAVGDQTYFLIMGLSSQAMKEGQIYFYVRSFSVLTTIFVPLLIAFIIPYLFSLSFIFAMNKRINKLNSAMGELNLKSQIILLEDKKTDEIGQLISHYNAMAQRIQIQTEQIKQFDYRRKILLSNLSHDLRTPLTMILGYAETIRTGMYKDEKELQASAKILLQRSRYMNTLLDQLLDISKQAEENFELYVEEHNVSELLRKIAADYLMFLEDQDYIVEIDIPEEDMIAPIDAALIERAVRNLLDNAIRYGSDGKYLKIQLTQFTNKLMIHIMDQGPGIPFEKQKLIFERFYRVDSSRKGDGLGIGLSIVKEIITFHGGTITLSSSPSRTEFQIQLPI